jgi:hypothetical protein
MTSIPINRLFPFILAFLFLPSVIMLHEGGHYIAATFLGMQPKLGYRSVSFGQSSASKLNRIVVPSAGPIVDLSFCLCGAIWLASRRQGKNNEPFSLKDWSAYIFSMACLRWLLQPMGLLIINPAGISDERKISLAIGLQEWFVPCVLSLIALIVIINSLYLSPLRSRLSSFLTVSISIGCGVYLWAYVLGPLIIR